jgi:hypothetical protein
VNPAPHTIDLLPTQGAVQFLRFRGDTEADQGCGEAHRMAHHQASATRFIGAGGNLKLEVTGETRTGSWQRNRK